MNPVIITIQEIIHELFGVDFTPEITPTPKPELGEYCFQVFSLAKILRKNPNEIAQIIAEKLREESSLFAGTNTVGGYVNFLLSDTLWMNIFREIRTTPEEKKNEMILVDYFAANIGKPLHIGHICTATIGQSILNVYAFLGYTTIGDSHLGDWGGIFGKLITGFQKYGSEEKLEADPIAHLLDIYVKISADIKTDESVAEACRNTFQKLSSGDSEMIAFWKKFTQHTLDEAEKVIAFLNVHPDYSIGESFYEGLPLPKLGDQPDLVYDMKSVVEELIEKQIATQNEDGSVGIVFPEETKIPSCILAKKDGTHGYLASDLACIKYRATNGWNPEKIIYCTDVRQELHFRQLFWTAEHAWADLLAGKELIHVMNGFISLKEGAMSTREGRFIELKNLIEESFSRTEKILTEKNIHLSEENKKAIAMGAIQYSYLSVDRERDIIFDWDKALSFEGNSGPYIQYAYVRAKKLADEARKRGIFPEEKNLREANLMVHDRLLIRMLAQFQEKVMLTAKTQKLHHLAVFLYELAVTLNAFYVHTPKILEEKNPEVRDFRLALIEKTGEMLKMGFRLLAIDMPSEM